MNNYYKYIPEELIPNIVEKGYPMRKNQKKVLTEDVIDWLREDHNLSIVLDRPWFTFAIVGNAAFLFSIYKVNRDLCKVECIYDEEISGSPRDGLGSSYRYGKIVAIKKALEFI